MDYTSGKHRGYAFVEFLEPEDAEEAIFNMDGAELLGRFLKCNLAQPNQAGKFSTSSTHNDAIWKSDDWFQQQSGVGRSLEEQQQREDLITLTE